MGARSESQFAAISPSTTNTTIVAAVTGRKIRVLGLVLVASGGANTASLESTAGGTALTGPMPIAATTGALTLPYNPVGWGETASGALLNLKLTAATAVGGAISYCLIDA